MELKGKNKEIDKKINLIIGHEIDLIPCYFLSFSTFEIGSIVARSPKICHGQSKTARGLAFRARNL